MSVLSTPCRMPLRGLWFLAPLAAAAPTLAQTTGTLDYAPVQAVPIPFFMLLLLSAVLAVLGLWLLRKRGAHNAPGLLMALIGGASLVSTGVHVQNVTAMAPAIELSSPGGGSVEVPFGVQEYRNTSGVPQAITGLVPPANCGSTALASACTVGLVLPVDGLCETAYTACPEVSIASEADGVESEQPTDGLFTLVRTGDTSGPLTVGFALAGTATLADDYTVGSSSSAEVTFAAGEATVDLAIEVLDDEVYDPDETVELTLAEGSGYTLGGTSTSSITIATLDRRIFISAKGERFTGNLGGVAGADAKCNANSFHPGDGSVFKAMLAAADRSPQPALDWVLEAGHKYFRVQGLPFIARANADARFDFPVSDFVGTELGTRVWTGINSDWSPAAANCQGWTTDDTATDGRAGGAFKTSSGLIDQLVADCNSEHALICVEQ